MGLIVHVRPVGHHSLINTRVERGKTLLRLEIIKFTPFQQVGIMAISASGTQRFRKELPLKCG